jgi:hypothetical protein
MEFLKRRLIVATLVISTSPLYSRLKDRKKANALAEKIAEFAALIDIEKHVDLNSRDGQEIASIVASLGESCPH